MADQQNVGQRLLGLKERADLSLEEIAVRAGYKGKSSVQEYFKASYPGPLGARVAVRLADALSGRGSPPISREEVVALAGDAPTPNATIVRYEGASLREMDETIPVFGTMLGAVMIADGEAIEQTTLNSGDIIERRPRPVMLNRKSGVYGLYVQGSSMSPAHDDGDFVVVQKDAPLSLGNDVVVYLRPRDESDDGDRATHVLIKRLVRRTAQYVELHQFQPEKTFRIAASDVLRMDRVMRLNEILS